MGKKPQASVNELLNWGAIEFPSDRLTLGEIRKGHLPLLQDADRGAHLQYSQFDTFAMLAAEMDIAAFAFAKAANLSYPVDKTFSRAALVDYLNRAYQSYGLSEGMSTSEQLVRKIEAAAERLAQGQIGRHP